MVTQSLARQNYQIDTEDTVNKQIQMYQMSQQTYLAAAAYFDKADVSLPGFVKFFHERAEHEGKMARHLIDYQMTRGGMCIINALPQPMNNWQSATNAIETCLALEKDINKALISLTHLAISKQDTHLRHILKSGHLIYKVETIENIAKGYIQIRRVGGEGLGIHMLDQDLHKYNKFAV